MWNPIILLYSFIMLPFYFVAGESSAISLSLIDSPFPSTNFNIEDLLFSPTNNAPTESVAPIMHTSPKCRCSAISHTHPTIGQLAARISLLEHELLELSGKVTCLIKETTADKAAFHRKITDLKQQRKHDRTFFQEYFISSERLLRQVHKELTDIHHAPFIASPIAARPATQPSIQAEGWDKCSDVDIEFCSSDDESSERNPPKKFRND